MSNIQEIFEESQRALDDLQKKIAKESVKLKDSLHQQLQVKLDADKLYESRWVFYHTILGIELFVVIVLLFLIWWKL
jgi:hypothetical protein|tara:strand:- start:1818 stop:2048 length:231 start_codon:yes stop_codon:yes gene_type:complete